MVLRVRAGVVVCLLAYVDSLGGACDVADDPNAEWEAGGAVGKRV